MVLFCYWWGTVDVVLERGGDLEGCIGSLKHCIGSFKHCIGFGHREQTRPSSITEQHSRINNIRDDTPTRTTFPNTSRTHQHLQHSTTNNIYDIRSETIYDNRPENFIPHKVKINIQLHENSSLNIEEHPTWNNTPPRTTVEISLLFKQHLT